MNVDIDACYNLMGNLTCYECNSEATYVCLSE